MGNVRMEARQINYRGGETFMNVEEAIKNAGSSYVLPIAASDTLGGVKVGDGLSIDEETGVLSNDNPTPYTLPTASDETKGGAKVGDDLKIADDTLSVEVEIETQSANTYEFDLSVSGGDDVTKKDGNTVISTEHVGTTANYEKNFDGRFIFAYDNSTAHYSVTLLKATTDAPSGTVYDWRFDYYPSMPNKKLVFEAETEKGTASSELQKIFDRIPPAPSTDGTYNLRATVSSGIPSYSWVSTT